MAKGRFIDADRVLASVDILAVIGPHVELKRSGQKYVALCPFHAERSPSFTVYPATQSFHCFGCGVGGNAISFLMQYRGLPFYEALSELAGGNGAAQGPPLRTVRRASTRVQSMALTAAVSAALDELQEKLLDNRLAARSGGAAVFRYMDRERLLMEALEQADELATAWDFCSHRTTADLKRDMNSVCHAKERAGKLGDHLEFGRRLGILGEAESRPLLDLLKRFTDGLDEWKGIPHGDAG